MRLRGESHPKSKLTNEQVLKIREFIDANHKVEGDLRREISINIKFDLMLSLHIV